MPFAVPRLRFGLGSDEAARPIYFIPPYEWYNDEQVRWAARLGVRLINLTPGSGSHRDWIPEGQRGFVPAAQIVDDILAFEAREPDGLNGFVLLLHLGSQRQDKLHPHVPRLLSELRARGYDLVRVDELFGEREKVKR